MHMPVPSEAELARYYAEHYRRDYHGETRPSPRRVMRAWKNGERIAARLAPILPKGAAVLEIGAGIGCTVKALELKGFAAWGLEPNRDFGRYGREMLRARIREGRLEDLGENDHADAVLLVHVIEHLVSPRRALARIHALLPERGLLYLECPNAWAPHARMSKMFHFAHIYNFTPHTLLALAAECGFALERMFTDEQDPNIEVLLVKSEPRRAAHELAGHAEAVLARLAHYNWWRYHLRREYLARRWKKLLGYAEEYLRARRFERALIARLHAAS